MTTLFLEIGEKAKRAFDELRFIGADSVEPGGARDLMQRLPSLIFIRRSMIESTRQAGS